MTHKVVMTGPATRDLNKIPYKVIDAISDLIFGAIANNPYRQGKPLSGKWEGYYSARRGSFRIVYSINDQTVVVTVIRIAHRAHAYR